MVRAITRHTLEGVREATASYHHFSTDDGLGLSMLRFLREPCDDVVVLLHGLTSSSDMFIMPEHENLVNFLLDNGFTDVWCVDLRISNRHSYNLYPNDYSLDDLALYDHPAAIAYIRSRIGAHPRLHVIGHCLGSMSFAMSLAATQVNGISSFVSNSISLTPYMPRWSHIKISLFPFILERILDVPYISPGWSREPRLSRGKLLARLISLFHHECDEPACHTLSLMWGTGWPALFQHENLDPRTHARLHDLFGGTGLNYHRHVRHMVNAGNRAVKLKGDDGRYQALPRDYFAAGLGITTPILFITGDQNRIFSDSNIRCFERMREQGVTQGHQLHVFNNYGHQDIFMGRRSAEEVFPLLRDFIASHGRG